MTEKSPNNRTEQLRATFEAGHIDEETYRAAVDALNAVALWETFQQQHSVKLSSAGLTADSPRTSGDKISAGDISGKGIAIGSGAKAIVNYFQNQGDLKEQRNLAALLAMTYVLHNVLNKVAVDTQMGRSDAYEVDQAIATLDYTEADDLLLYDRNFASYQFLATLTKRQRNFGIRCSSGSFGIAQRLFAADQEASEVATLSVPIGKKKAIEEEGLPLSITVRFVTVRFSTEELRFWRLRFWMMRPSPLLI